MEVTGYCKTRLTELKKYVQTDIFSLKYISSTNKNNNGVDYRFSTENNITYYIDNITFIDILNNNSVVTKFRYIATGLDESTSSSFKLYKDNKKENIISKPKIKNDVFIVRQQIGVFDRISRLNWVVDMKN